MAKQQYSNEIREQAFLFWYDCRNDTEVVRLLKQAGYSITRATISSWREKYSWEHKMSAYHLKKACF